MPNSYNRKKTRQYFFASTRIFYPIRPLVTLCLGIGLAALAFIPGVPLFIPIFLAVNTLSDDLVFFPFLRIVNAFRNLINKRKRVKAIITLLATIGGITAGTLIAVFVLIHIPLLLNFTAMISGALGCGITVFLAASTLLAGIFHLLDLPTLIGAFIGSSLVTFIPPLTGTSLDLIIGTALLTGFAISLLSKHLLRLFYKIKEGHSNADGYFFLHKESSFSKKKEADLAKLFQTSSKVIVELRLALIKVIKNIKKNDNPWNELFGLRQLRSNSFKDMLYLLSTDNKENIAILKELISYQAYDKNELANFRQALATKKIDIDKLKLETGNLVEYSRLSWRITKRYGYISYLTNDEAHFMYSFTTFIKGIQAGLTLCDESVKAEYQQAITHFIT